MKSAIFKRSTSVVANLKKLDSRMLLDGLVEQVGVDPRVGADGDSREVDVRN